MLISFPKIPVLVDHKTLNRFKRVSRELFPRESFGYLLGEATATAVEIKEIWIPEDIQKHSTRFNVFPQPAWVADVLEYAREHDLTTLGNIHSHCYKIDEGYTDPTPSAQDIDSGHCNQFFGICVVWETKNGLKTRCRFWGPMMPVSVKTV